MKIEPNKWYLVSITTCHMWDCGTHIWAARVVDFAPGAERVLIWVPAIGEVLVAREAIVMPCEDPRLWPKVCKLLKKVSGWLKNHIRRGNDIP